MDYQEKNTRVQLELTNRYWLSTEYQFIFCSINKVASTVFRKLMLRLNGSERYHGSPWHNHTKLEALDLFSLAELESHFNNPRWTKAIILRDPFHRLISAYIHLVKNGHGDLFKKADGAVDNYPKDFGAFLQAITNDKDELVLLDKHWNPQVAFFTDERIFDFILDFDNLQAQAKELLLHLGCWESHGRTGWGKNKDKSFLEVDDAWHVTNAAQKVNDPVFGPYKAKVQRIYAEDYALLNRIKFGKQSPPNPSISIQLIKANGQKINVEKTPSKLAINKGDKHYSPLADFQQNFTGSYFTTLFQNSNKTHPQYFVFHLARRGFFAEITTVARAAIYAHVHHLQLVLKNDHFGFFYQKGWADYYLPFCKEYNPSMENKVVQHCNPAIRSKLFLKELIAHRPAVINMGPFTIYGFDEILRFFMLILCRPLPVVREQAQRSVQQMGLPFPFAAIHIRRGDKVGDEDIFYPVNDYWKALAKHGGQDYPIFILTDDYKGVLEFKALLQDLGKTNPVHTLCQPSNSGFDVWAIREQRHAYEFGKNKAILEKNTFIKNTYDNAFTLVIETLIASKSEIFVGTRRSNVSKSIKFLHNNPSRCFLLDRPAIK